jgi:hypothetical protein
MDRKLSKDEEIERLTLAAAAARAHLSNQATLLRQKLDVPARLHTSLKHHPTGWLFGSLASGLAASLLFRNRSHRGGERKPRGFLLAVFGLILTVVRPFAKVWVTDQLKNYLTGKPMDLAFLTPARRTRPNNPF